MPQRLPATPLPLFNSANTRTLEQAALAWHPQPSLMQRAGRACAQLAQALAPHAQQAIASVEGLQGQAGPKTGQGGVRQGIRAQRTRRNLGIVAAPRAQRVA